MTRIPDEDLTPVRDIFSRLQDNVQEADGKAQAALDGQGDIHDAAGQAQAAASAASSAAESALAAARSAAGSASGASGAAQDAASRVATLAGAVDLIDNRLQIVESRTSTAGGFGPNTIATASTPADIRRAVAAAGGFVGNGTNDQVGANAWLEKYGMVVAVQGDYGVNAPIVPPARRRLTGWGTATNFVAGEGLSDAMISVRTDHVHLDEFAMSGNYGRADTSTWKGEAAGTHHLVVDNTTKDGFWTGSESTVFISGLVSRNAKGRGITWTGSFNRDSKILMCHIYNSGGDAFYGAVVDGMVSHITVGTPGGGGAAGYGFNFTSKCANLEVTMLKAWYCELDGFILDTIRCGYSHLQAQDCRKAGIRLLGDGLNTLYNASADSNSYISGNGNRGLHSGFEIGLNAATVVGTPGSKAQYKGNDWTISGIRAYDKRETGDARGYNQRHGVLIGSGVTDLDLSHVKTGRTTGTHHNLVNGVAFADLDTAGKSAVRSDGANSFTAVRSHGVLV